MNNFVFKVSIVVLVSFTLIALRSYANEFDDHTDSISISRDIPNFYNPDSVTFIPKSTDTSVINSSARFKGAPDFNDCTYLDPCNNIYFPVKGSATCDPVPPFDPFGNKIDAVGWYGTDDRQSYYVYYPNNKSSASPVVLLIHGGAWSIGPDPFSVNGWIFQYGIGTDNLVADLLDEGYVVVSMIYRLSRYGAYPITINANPIEISDQIQDIEDCVDHIAANFSTCLNINADEIQIIGESAGAHLALMYAYEVSDTTFLKSVISLYAPTNMNHYGDYLNSPTNSYICNNIYFWIGCAHASSPYRFWYYAFNELDPAIEISSTFIACTPKIVNCIPSPDDTTSRADFTIYYVYNFLQSACKTSTSTPLTNATIEDYSPHHVLGSDREIPTFIIHGKSDEFVPYEEATDGMQDKLDTYGGLIQTSGGDDVFDGVDIPPSSTIAASSDLHLIKLWPGGNHGLNNLSPANTTRLREEIIIWLNSH